MRANRFQRDVVLFLYSRVSENARMCGQSDRCARISGVAFLFSSKNLRETLFI